MLLDARHAAWRKQAPSQRNTQKNSISLHPFDTMQHATCNVSATT
jgi:hypothetical protein